MKVMAFAGSPHNDGTSSAALDVLCGELEKEGIDVEKIHVGDKLIHGCVSCGSCAKMRLCRFKDDIVNDCIVKAREADGIVLATPVYYGGIAGTFKSFLDRMFYTGIDLRYKAAAALVTVRRTGGIDTYHQLCNYLTLGGAVITPTRYWNVTHGTNAEEGKEDSEGLYTMEVAGRNMAWLMKALESAKKSIPLPVLSPAVWTNFVR
jgi:multimeric flavodoxin WrbA